MKGAISVRDYGAKGDGVTDDTQAIQKALDTGSSRVLIPIGQFIITNSIEPCSHQELEINGILEIADSNIQPVVVDVAEGQSDVTVGDAGGYRIGQWVTVCDDDNEIQRGGRQIRLHGPIAAESPA
jgi:polygalacturonase